MSRLFARRRQRRQRPTVARTLFVLFACTFMVPSTLSASPVAAQDIGTPAADLPAEALTDDSAPESESTMDEPLAATEDEVDETIILSIAKWDCNDPATHPTAPPPWPTTRRTARIR